jgi:hypothetical protein
MTLKLKLEQFRTGEPDPAQVAAILRKEDPEEVTVLFEKD